MIYNSEETKEEKDAPEAPPSGDMVFEADDQEPPVVGLCGEITEEAVQNLSIALISFNGGRILNPVPPDDPEDIQFFISSTGGSVTDMFTIYDLMQLIKNDRDIATFGYGKIYSAAVPLLAGGTRGKRYISKNTRVMIHHCSANFSGTHPEVRSNFQELKTLEDMMVATLAENSNLSAGEIYNIYSKNTDEFFSAEDALEMGLVDKII